MVVESADIIVFCFFVFSWTISNKPKDAFLMVMGFIALHNRVFIRFENQKGSLMYLQIRGTFCYITILIIYVEQAQEG